MLTTSQMSLMGTMKPSFNLKMWLLYYQYIILSIVLCMYCVIFSIQTVSIVTYVLIFNHDLKEKKDGGLVHKDSGNVYH